MVLVCQDNRHENIPWLEIYDIPFHSHKIIACTFSMDFRLSVRDDCLVSEHHEVITRCHNNT